VSDLQQLIRQAVHQGVTGATWRTSKPASDALAFIYTETKPMTKGPKRHVVDTLANAPQSRFMQLHESVEGQALPPLRADFVAHLDRVRAQANTTDAKEAACAEMADLDDERKGAALARLREEHGRLYGVLFLTDLQGLSLRATGRHLGMDHHTVVKHRGRAIALIRAWSTDDRQAS